MRGHVVVGIDGSPSALAAVRWATDDAVRRDAGVRVVHVIGPWVYAQPLTTPPGFQESLAEQSRAVLAQAADVARQRPCGPPVETVELTGNVHAELLEQARGAESLVVGSRGLGGFMGLLLGSVSIGLAGHADCPVVVVRQAEDVVHGEIVVGHDGSPDSETALEYAFEEAGRRGVRLRAIYAWESATFIGMVPSYTPDLEKVYDLGQRAAKEQLAPWEEKHPQVQVRDSLVCAHPVEALAKASAAADLVVVGSRGRGAIGSAVLGSVSHGVLHHAHCPVAVVRSRPLPADRGAGRESRRR